MANVAPTVISQRTRALTSSSRASAMSRNYPADTAKQRFMEETYNKETSIRLGWYFSPAGRRFVDASSSADGGGNSRQMEVSRRRIEDACPKPTSALLRLRDRYETPPDYRKKAFRLDGLPITDSTRSQAASTVNNEGKVESAVDDVPVFMNTPERKTLDKLYVGLSCEGRGRSDYLRCRKAAAPEVKYPDPVLSSMEYGWRLGDVLPEPVKPTHARSRLVHDTFYARNGINTLVVPASQ